MANFFPLPNQSAIIAAPAAVATPIVDPLIKHLEAMHASMITMMNTQLLLIEKMTQQQHDVVATFAENANNVPARVIYTKLLENM